MKQKFQCLFYFILLGAMGTTAQPVITAAGFNPRIGESFKLQNTTIGVIPPDSGGANRIWDYSILKDSGTSISLSVLSPQGLPYSDSFPTSNIAIVSDTNSVNYWLANDTCLGKLGYYSQPTFPIIDRYLPIQVNMLYPIIYQKPYFFLARDNYQTYIDSVWKGGMYYSILDSLKYDGYGTLKLPNGTYDSVLRIQQWVYNSTGLLMYYPGSYLFIKNGIHWPLLTLQPQRVFINGLETYLWNATYYKGTTLPLQITSLTASWKNSQPVLQWDALNTENTKAFNIQRSDDGHCFTTVGQVATTSSSSYCYSDNFIPQHTLYYRLQQVDKNGVLFYSNTVQLVAKNHLFSVYPNPAKDDVHISISTVNPSVIMIYDVSGKLVYQDNNYLSNKAISTTNWSKGTYLVKIKVDGDLEYCRFEKK